MMNHKYDFIIVGAGPAGLAFAHCCSKIGKKILIIDKENDIGGCHRVRRVNGLFTEHGPRVYSNTYKIFEQFLIDMGYKFEDLFTKYDFGITTIGGETIFSTLHFNELFYLMLEFLKLVIFENHGRYTILEDYLKHNNFSNKSIDMIDRICKLTDGGGADKFTLNEFLQLFNQQFFYTLYQPKTPNDKGLFKIWKQYLESKNVDFILDCNIKDIIRSYDRIESIIISHNNQTRSIVGENIILAIPPKNLYDFINKYNIRHDWGDLLSFSKDTAYIDYISVTFHWDKPLTLPKVYGFPRSSWGVAFVVLSNYMTFDESSSKTVISASVSICDVISPNNKKTANECNVSELMYEMYLQLKESFGGNLPQPTVSILSPGVKYDEINKQWISLDTAFITSSLQRYLPFHNNETKNLYNLGTHNGKSLYKFTSLESAVSNSVFLCKKLYPEFDSITVKKLYSLTDCINLIILVIIIYFLYFQIVKIH